MRLFIGIPFDDPTLENIITMQESCMHIMDKGVLTQREQLHMTLIFLGEVPPQQVPVIVTCMEKISLEAFTLTFNHLGTFRQQQGALLWLGISPQPTCISMQKELAAAIRNKGYTLENRKFTPHVTIARKVIWNKASQSAEKSIKVIEYTASVKKICLYQSSFIHGRLEYSVIHTQNLH